MGIKVDANPGRTTTTQTTPDRIGTYHVKCAELCGLLHADMETDAHVVSSPRLRHMGRHSGEQPMTVVETYKTDPIKGSPDGGIMRRLNVGTGIAAGIVLALVAHRVAGHLADDHVHEVDVRATATMVGWAIGFMAGIGAFTGPIRWMVGRDLTHADELFLAGKDQGIGRYFRFTTDHKVVGIQYLVLTMVMLGAGGTMAMLIRTDLISPNSGFLGPQTYNSLVGLHGLTMILATIIMVTGPFGNFVVPLDDRRPRHGVPASQRPQPVAAGRHAAGAVLGGLPRRNPDGVGRLHPDRAIRGRRAWTPTWWPS